MAGEEAEEPLKALSNPTIFVMVVFPLFDGQKKKLETPAWPPGLPRPGSSARAGAQRPAGTPVLPYRAGPPGSAGTARTPGTPAEPAQLLTSGRRKAGRRGPGLQRRWAPPSRASSPTGRRHLVPCPYSAGAAILCPPRAVYRPWRGCRAACCSSAWRPPPPAPIWCWRRCGARWTSARTWPRSRPSSASPMHRAARPPPPSCWRWSPGWSPGWPTWACR